ncbi:hypothetical protein [Planococcus koreensis]|uniref:hypothetical protein n=1 Tax=Planococcus koreensis TaxID=112331 RepID=UPI0039FBABBF
MATIYTAIYRIGSETKEIELLSINPENYFRKYKNKLFCSEQNCHAKLCYVAMPGNKRRSYLRTWRNSSHVESCLHFTEVIKNGPRKRSTESITAIASEDQISNSLKQAFQLESMSEKELEKRREEDRRKRANRIRRNSGKKTEQLSIIELVTNPEELAIASKELKGGKLLKRNVDALKDVDLGKTRTVIGNFLELKHTQERTIIRVEKTEVAPI